MIICENCGKEFNKDNLLGRPRKYCSALCQKENDKKTKRIQYVCKSERAEQCVFCGAKLTGKQVRFCSNECRFRYNRIKRGRCLSYENVKKICKVCGKEFETYRQNKTTCSLECRKKLHNNSNPEHDRRKYLKKHPNARTREEIHSESLLRQEQHKNEIEKRKQQREAEWAEARARKETEKKANIAKYLEYEAEHECVVCGSKYIAHHPFAKYCSKTCARKNTRSRDNRNRYKNITVDKGITLPKLAKRDHNQCQICGLFVDWEDFIETNKTKICGDMYPSIDHIMPISLGGMHSWNNVQLAHRGCNTKKKNKYIG